MSVLLGRGLGIGDWRFKRLEIRDSRLVENGVNQSPISSLQSLPLSLQEIGD
jgi:hypothetical protein